MLNGSFIIARITEDGVVPYRGAIAHVSDRANAFKRLEAVRANNSANSEYLVLRVYRAKAPAAARS